MRKIISLGIFLAVSMGLFAQADKSQFLYTSDGKLIGNKNLLVKECADAIDPEEIAEADKTEMCECVLREMAGHLTYKEFNKMLDDNFDFEGIFEDKKHKEMANGVLQCLFSMVQKGEGSALRDQFMKECISGFEEEMDEDMKGIDAQTYCNCMLDKIVENAALTDNLMKQLKDENSPLIQEAAVPCVLEAMGIGEESDTAETVEDSVEVYVIDPLTLEETVTKVPNPEKAAPLKSEDIKGDILSVEIPLTRHLSTYALKVKMGSVEERFTLDSGASDVLINKELERKLLDAGVISKADEVGEKVYSLADGRKVKAKVYVLNGLEVGGFRVDNVMTGVLSENASLLLGKSFLDKFTRWNIDNEKKTLYLEK